MQTHLQVAKQKQAVWNPLSIISNLIKHKELIKQLTKREVVARYKGSYLGIAWSFLTPLLMLVIYTFVFSVIFKAKWGVGSDSKTEFALVLFCGLITYNLFSEVVSRAPSLILANVNYVKKVVFPLEILPVVALGSALVNLAISLVILIVGLAILLQTFHWTIVLLPLVLLPLVLFTTGFAWFLASLGVYIRDIGQVIGVAIQILMFMSPIFYPISSIPKEFQEFFYWNPISFVVEDMRRILVWGQFPDWNWLLFGTLLGGLFTVLGYVWFQRTRGGFADVL
ncbi:ABC transporter permease [Effusibacillus dendaii]|uniref:Transport permease protein n=1 Tax=Effusibacillus dendaii TaxID=2743772 RepID=A0A7I8DG02_9BACL|nr:ABC transporter permease [Effusibacillus dendaii]BCJ87786.1 transport permease protein [Effusibacillus dendaii]